MSRAVSLVQLVEIASPCTASWDEMQGDDRSRFCSHCKLNVYNLSAMAEEEGERLIIEKEGKLCARLYRRKDGTVITKDCPVALAALRRRMLWTCAKTVAALLVIAAAAWRLIAGTSVHHDNSIIGFSANLPWDPPRSVFEDVRDTLVRWMDEQAPVRFMGDIGPAPIVNSSNASPSGD